MTIKTYLTLCLISLMFVVNIARASVYIFKDNVEKNNVLTCQSIYLYQKIITESRISGISENEIQEIFNYNGFTQEFINIMNNEIKFIYMLPKPIDALRVNELCTNSNRVKI